MKYFRVKSLTLVIMYKSLNVKSEVICVKVHKQTTILKVLKLLILCFNSSKTTYSNLIKSLPLKDKKRIDFLP